MSIRNLEGFFRPRAIAVIGASDRPHSIGATLIRNMLEGGFDGVVMPVNHRQVTVAGVAAWPSVEALPQTPDLAVICVPPTHIPGLIHALGARGTRAAVVITAGLSSARMPDGATVAEAMLAAARPHLLRIIGPNCLGMLVPGIGLNASFAPAMARPGRLAFVSQSGALATAVLDWGNSQDIGFSCFISIGDSLDVDLGDLLDYLGRHPHTSAVLLYIESIKNPRKFLSAARAAARAKPVIAVKAGRAMAGARAAASHTGALAGNDEIVDAVLRRAGILRVETTQDLFAAAETLARSKPYLGPRVALMTNGGGAGVMATDALVAAGGELAVLSAETLATLDSFLPTTWSRSNPLDIIGDAPVERYVETLKVLTRVPEVDAVIFMHAPTAIEDSLKIAQALAPVIKASGRTVFTSFLGGDCVASARRYMASQGIPGYPTPEEAVRAFLQTVDFARLQALLLETPPREAPRASGKLEDARRLVQAVVRTGRTLLTELESKQILIAAGVPTVRTERAENAEAAARVASEIGFPVALKILSPDISHKSDVGGIALNLGDAEAVRESAAHMLKRIGNAVPGAVIEGFTVQAMARTQDAHELILGCINDPVFGPVLMFGQGGTAVEVLKDRAFALPPLNVPLARALVARTRVASLLAGYRNRPAAAMDELHGALINLSALVMACPEIIELDINPLLADASGVCALDARIRVMATDTAPDARLLIRPYPGELESSLLLAGRPVVLRPIRPEDEPLHAAFLAKLRPEHVYFRFFQMIREWTHPQLARLTQIDYDREMAFVAVDENGAFLGVSRGITDPDNDTSEFAIVVRSDHQGEGLGQALMEKLIDYARSRGTLRMVGFILAQNTPMMTLATQLGFKVMSCDEAGVYEVSLQLNADPAGDVPNAARFQSRT
ncbi:MAG: hypothetical protein RL434_1108 [Pseudomonadota bacterium]|jgi:acetyltransferase